MDTLATSYFSYALMVICARKVARLAQTDAEAAADYFDMHAQQLSEFERAEFEKAVVDAATALAMQQAS
jgi:diadenosine tetraphosphate (Ap4A) HIT family hydrolase